VEKKFVVFVPLHEEMKYAHAHMLSKHATCPLPYDPQTNDYTFHYTLTARTSARVRFCVIGDMGNAYTLARITPIIEIEKPHGCFLVGLAGSLKPDGIRLGDVVVSSRSKSLYPDKVKKLADAREEVREKSRLSLPDPNGLLLIDDRKVVLGDNFLRFRRMFARATVSEPIAHDYVRYASTAAPLPLKGVTASDFPVLRPGSENPNPSPKEGTIFGSDMVVDSEKYVAFVLERNTDDSADYYHQKAGGRSPLQKWFRSDLEAVDMETFGFLLLSQVSGEHFGFRLYFAVRGISDLATDKEPLDKSTSDKVREIAIFNAVEVTLDMIDYILRNNLGPP
jgi:nucleoside phosphorylase